MPVSNDLTGSFFIDQGEAENLSVGAPVLCSKGLIGVVSEVSNHSAKVTTLLSAELSVGAVCLQSGDSGIVEGSLRYAADQRTKMIYINTENTVKEGDLIVTSGTTGLFPRGLQIGTVEKVGIEETGLTAYAVIRPAVDLDALESVTVLLDFNGKGVASHE
jgi:rod shape-determining protein MreC